MSNGQPPFPPFRPNFPPGAPPSGLPPFPPKGGAPPHFSPSYASGGPGSRPPAPYPPPSGHPGLGLPRPPTGLPIPPHQTSNKPATPNRRDDVKTTKVFVGSIAPGITDRTLRDLLNACGPLFDLKRVEGANGKPQAFGFASFESPEVVLRCIRCLNGIELPDLSPEGRQEGRAKALVVKADQKTAAFLQEFEETLGRSDTDESADAACRAAINNIVGHLTDWNQRPEDRHSRSGRLSPIQVVVPAHLQDLKEGDLPEAQRVAVLDQIAIFRENAARREREKKIADDDRERFKSMPSSHVGYGYGTRAFPKQTAEPPKGDGHPRGARKSRETSKDPQGYSSPVAFVRPETAEGKGESERTDEEDEAVRQQRRERERALALRDREHRVETRERQRIDSAVREETIQQQRVDAEAKLKRTLASQFEHWDDDELDERGKELFYSDRAQWRIQRQQQRLREEEDDLEDRRLEDAENKALEAESEDFLRQQMAEITSMEENQRQKGLLAEDAAPIKVAIVPKAKPEVKDEPQSAHPAPKPALALGDDEDDSVVQKKKRALVKLEYEQSVDAAEEKARRTARLLEISKHLPTATKSIFGGKVDWQALEMPNTRSKLAKSVERKITDALGELDQDLAEFVMDHLAAHKGPDELVEELNPVLAEETDGFVVQLWRQLIFESEAAAEGLETGTMTV